MKICIIGIGYIGLPMACILCNKGFKVVGVDINEEYINSLKNNEFKSKEKHLTEMVRKSLERGNLSLKSNPEKADVFIICTPTPLNQNNDSDLSYLINGINSIIPYLDKGNIIIIESTIPPKTTKNIIRPIIELAGLTIGIDIFLAYCPERIIPGNIIFELINNDRVIGGYTRQCGSIVGEFYKRFINGRVHITTSEIAEMVKLVENSYRDVNIALVNEIAMICNRLSINPSKVIALANKHPRVNLLDFGIGVGGDCLPVDPYFIIKKAPDLSQLMQVSRSINDSIPEYIVSKIEKVLEPINAPKIGIWGVTYKANSDDTRNSPAMKIVGLLKSKDYDISIYDPLVDGINCNKTKYESIVNADLLILLVNHDEFKEENYKLISSFMKTQIIFDPINIINKSRLPSDIRLYNLENI